MSRPAALAYRCRHCNAIFHPAHVPDGPLAMKVALGLADDPPGWGSPVTPTEVHRCSDRMMGVGDFAGVVLDESG